jgi:O-antigen/teichoic acid export membrane protein
MNFLKFIKSKLLKGHTRSIKVKKNILILLFVKGYSVIINLILIPFTLDLLDNYKYGVWITILNVLSFIHLFDIGLGNGLRNKFAEAMANNDFKSAQEYVSTGYFLLGGMTIVLILLFITPWVLINWSIVFNVSENLSEDISALIGITFIFTAIHFTLKLITTLLTADHKPWISVLILAISNTIIILMFLFLKSFLIGNLLAIGIIYTLIPLLVLVIASFIAFTGYFKSVRPKLSAFKKEKIRDLFNLGLRFFMIQIAVLVIFQTDSIIISHVLGPEEVTPYNIVFRYFSIVTVLAGVIMTPLWSAFTEANAQKDFVWMKTIIYKQLKLFIPQVICVLLLIYCAKWIIPYWIGRNIQIPPILLIGMAVFAIQLIWNNIFSFFLNGISYTKTQTITSFIGLSINIPLSIYLANKYGAGGVIIASILSLSFFAIFGALETFKFLNKNETIS